MKRNDIETNLVKTIVKIPPILEKTRHSRSSKNLNYILPRKVFSEANKTSKRIQHQ